VKNRDWRLIIATALLTIFFTPILLAAVAWWGFWTTVEVKDLTIDEFIAAVDQPHRLWEPLLCRCRGVWVERRESDNGLAWVDRRSVRKLDPDTRIRLVAYRGIVHYVVIQRLDYVGGVEAVRFSMLIPRWNDVD